MDEEYPKKKSHRTIGGLLATLACGIVVFVAQWAWGEYWNGVESVKSAKESFDEKEDSLVKRIEELERSNKSLKEKLSELKDDHNKDSDEVWTAWGKHQTRMNNLEIKSGVIEGLIESFRLEHTVARAIRMHDVKSDPWESEDGDGWEGDDSAGGEADLPDPSPAPLPPPPTPDPQKPTDYEELLNRVKEVERERETERDPLEYKRWIQEQRIQQMPELRSKK